MDEYKELLKVIEKVSLDFPSKVGIFCAEEPSDAAKDLCNEMGLSYFVLKPFSNMDYSNNCIYIIPINEGKPIKIVCEGEPYGDFT